ncbi:hypothetical protein ANO11243_074490 [Dothideomycetidae sp. 11243]|nr:hypothetical protein ANO11243_074490 [fungal sp. No.11243]
MRRDRLSILLRKVRKFGRRTGATQSGTKQRPIQFSELPAELRQQIWADTLPDTIGPTLCCYRRGFWRLRDGSMVVGDEESVDTDDTSVVATSTGGSSPSVVRGRRSPDIIPSEGDWTPRHPTDINEILSSDSDESSSSAGSTGSSTSSDSSDSSNQDTVIADFRYDILGETCFECPAALVNDEAHEVAARWAERQGGHIRQNGNKPAVFVRPFNLERDAVYIPLGKAHDAILPSALPGHSNDYHSWRFHVQNVAIPLPVLFWGLSRLDDLDFTYRSSLRKIFVLLDPPPGLDAKDGQQRFEYRSLAEGSYAWDPELKEMSYHGEKASGFDANYKIIEDAIASFDDWEFWIQNHVGSGFEIRPIVATKAEGSYTYWQSRRHRWAPRLNLIRQIRFRRDRFIAMGLMAES